MRRRCSPLIRVLFLVVAARLCFAPPLTWSLGVVASEEKHKELKLVNDYDYPIVRITTVNITRESYRAFIVELRRYLGSNNEERHGIPLLPRDTSVTIGTRFVLVEISNSWEQQSVTLALDVTDVYVVGYRAGNHSVFFQPDRPDVEEAIQHIFTDTERLILPFPGRYDAMTVSRKSVPLGRQALEDSVSSMYWYAQQPSPSAQNSLVRAFLVTIQMVSEAARFLYLEDDFSQRILFGRNTCPDPSVIALENAWGRLSEEIRDTGEGRPFRNAVRLERRNGTDIWVNTVSPLLIAVIGLLRNVRSGPPSSSSSTPLLRLVTSTKPEDATTTTTSPPVATVNNMVEEEPTLRIVGPDGMCVDVKEEHYNNGNPIILWPCKSSNYWNQLWTFKADRTIQSNGKCLAAYGNSPGGYVMIYDCNPQSVAFTWQVWDNGTIISDGGVALSVPASAAGTELTVEYANYAVGQGWRPTNNTEPLVAPIVGVFGLCLQVLLQGNGDGGGHLLMQSCALGMPDQQWALYPDGSIRPQESSSSCLTAPGEGGGAAAPVTVSSCDLSSALQRWEFTNDGTIVTLRDKLVLEAQGYSNPFLSQIIVNGYTGRPSQMWQALVLL